METVLITGGTGMIGKALTEALVTAGYKVIVLSRKKEKNQQKAVRYAQWDVAAQTIEEGAIKEADYIVHLAGANVADGRWTEKRKQEIIDSRVKTGALLVKALTNIPNNVKAVISASAIGWYGPDAQVPNPHPFVETDPANTDFLGETCKLWEAAIAPVKELQKRLVTFRIGIVLSNDGGAYAEFKKPLKFGIASVLGSGEQTVSWIHIDDLIQLVCFALKQERMHGVYNAVAPNPVSNAQLIKTMAKTKTGIAIQAPVPAFVLKIMLGEMSIEVLKSATVSAAEVKGEGFLFQFPTIEQAVEDLNKKAPL
jgi:uncharacterized protein (TIGR01777 family)